MAWRPAGQLDGLQMFETAARFAALLSRITSHHITSHHMSHAQHDEREIVLTHCRVQPPRRRPPTSKTTTKNVLKKKLTGAASTDETTYICTSTTTTKMVSRKKTYTHTHTLQNLFVGFMQSTLGFVTRRTAASISGKSRGMSGGAKRSTIVAVRSHARPGAAKARPSNKRKSSACLEASDARKGRCNRSGATIRGRVKI